MSDIATRVMVVDDHILFREGLISLFRFAPEFQVIDGAGSVQEAVEKAKVHRPDIILMDFSLPDGTGLDATRSILNDLPACQIVFLTVHDTDDKLFAAIRMGARGFLLKNVASSDLISSLRALGRGEWAVSRQMTGHVMREFSRTDSAPAASADQLLSRLSARELDVFRELEAGGSNAEIARHLFLSENTVKHHLRNVFDKLNLDNRHQAAILARQLGIRSKAATKLQ